MLRFCHRAYMKSNFHMPLLFFHSDHLRYIEYWIGKMSIPLPARFDSLPKLCKEIFSIFSIMNSRHSAEGKKMSTASQSRAVEAQYQAEFYRGFVHTAGRGVPISSEQSRTKDGRVDFYISAKKWATGLLRDHIKVNEHLSIQGRWKISSPAEGETGQALDHN